MSGSLDLSELDTVAQVHPRRISTTSSSEDEDKLESGTGCFRLLATGLGVHLDFESQSDVIDIAAVSLANSSSSLPCWSSTRPTKN
jgi:hypothetical protein